MRHAVKPWRQSRRAFPNCTHEISVHKEINVRTQSFVWSILAALALIGSARAQETVVAPDLGKIADGKTFKLVNLDAEVVREDGKQFVRLKAKGREQGNGSNAGVALVDGLEFKQGTIEVDLKGRNVRQQSFLGVTFHALDNKTLETVYFRPFNFKADPPFRTRAVQYVSWPENTWEKLRKETPGVYENAVQPIPDPDGWFHARIEVTAQKVTVFVNEAKEPSLVVHRLTDRSAGGVGLWIDIFDGAFANLKITPR